MRPHQTEGRGPHKDAAVLSLLQIAQIARAEAPKRHFRMSGGEGGRGGRGGLSVLSEADSDVHVSGMDGRGRADGVIARLKRRRQVKQLTEKHINMKEIHKANKNK